MGSLRAAAGGLIVPLLAWAAASPRVLRFTGEAKLGQRFERQLGRNLVFILQPSRSEPGLGWDITVRPRGIAAGHDTCEDLVWPATPPFRFDNPRYLDTSYGKQAADSARPGLVREMEFLLDCPSARRQRQLIDTVLWPANHPPGAASAAMAKLGREARARLRLRMIDSRVDAAANRIEWVRFAVEVTWPR